MRQYFVTHDGDDMGKFTIKCLRDKQLGGWTARAHFRAFIGGSFSLDKSPVFVDKKSAIEYANQTILDHQAIEGYEIAPVGKTQWLLV